MSQYIGFGNGSDGIVSSHSAPVNVSCSGTSGSTSLSATGAFSAGQMLLIHQSRGTGVGQWEFNQVASYVAGTITTVLPLAYTYTDSGASQAQVLVIPQYSQATIGSYSPPTWDGSIGGISGFFCSGKTTITGTINGDGVGFRGGKDTGKNVAGTGNQAEGTGGEGGAVSNSETSSPNGNGGGGGYGPATDAYDHQGGAGGGHSTAGDAHNNTNGGVGGSAAGAADMTTMVFGGGGGSGGRKNGAVGGEGAGARGGGLFFCFSRIFVLSGGITVDGGTGTATPNNDDNSSAGGGGSGGSVFIKAVDATIGTGLITATAGIGGTGRGPAGINSYGSNGSTGRVRVESCTLSGTSDPSASAATGGHTFCAVGGGVFST